MRKRTGGYLRGEVHQKGPSLNPRSKVVGLLPHEFFQCYSCWPSANLRCSGQGDRVSVPSGDQPDTERRRQGRETPQKTIAQNGPTSMHGYGPQSRTLKWNDFRAGLRCLLRTAKCLDSQLGYQTIPLKSETALSLVKIEHVQLGNVVLQLVDPTGSGQE
jgi:hypothetical protein